MRIKMVSISAEQILPLVNVIMQMFSGVLTVGFAVVIGGAVLTLVLRLFRGG
jgi:hypothetical protein